MRGLKIGKMLIAFCMKGTCSSGPSKISMLCHRTKPLVVRAGILGGLKSSVVG